MNPAVCCLPFYSRLEIEILTEPLHPIANQLRTLARQLERFWEEQSRVVVDYSVTDYRGREEITWKRSQQTSEYALAAGNLLLEAFDKGAFRKDYGLCNVLGERRKQRQRLIRLPRRSRVYFTPEHCARYAFLEVCRHWLKHTRRGFDWRWKYRYLEPEQRYALICRSLADYLEQESEASQSPAEQPPDPRCLEN